MKNFISEQSLSFGSLNKPKIIQHSEDEKTLLTENDQDYLYESKGRVLELRRDSFTPKQLRFDQVGYRNYKGNSPKYILVRDDPDSSSSSSSS